MKTRPACLPTTLSMAAAAALLAACGGGGGDTPAPPDTTVSQASAESMSANSAVIATEGTDASAVVLQAAKAVVATGQASVTVNCAGGGTAVFTASGNAGTLGNGVLDTGEVYSVSFTQCRGSAGAASVNGQATLTVLAAGGGTTQVATTTQGLTVGLPHRTLTHEGSSTFTETVATNGAATTTTQRWQSAQVQLTSQRELRTSRYTLSDVDLTRVVATSGGTLTGSTASGHYTMSADLPNLDWSITVETQRPLVYDAGGALTDGQWTMTLPHNRVGVNVTLPSVTVTLDRGPDGTIDQTWVFTVSGLAAEAG
jgi:hypothetical protein